MRRFLIILVFVVIVSLAAGLALSVFFVGGKNFIGFPLPILQWHRALPPIPGLPAIDSGPELSVAGLFIDVLVWTTITMIAHGLATRLRRRRGS
jgi:hypothetical protein